MAQIERAGSLLLNHYVGAPEVVRLAVLIWVALEEDHGEDPAGVPELQEAELLPGGHMAKGR